MDTKQLPEELSEICQTIVQTVDTDLIYLFGSYAYGTPDADSDYDLCVIIPDDSLRSSDAVKKIRKALYQIQTTALDVVVYRKSSFQQRAEGPSFEKRIADNGILLFDRSACS